MSIPELAGQLQMMIISELSTLFPGGKPVLEDAAHEDVFAGNTGRLDALAHFLLIVVYSRSIDMAIT